MITGKQIVVTGGSRGIGRGLVEKLLQRNNKVIATTRNPSDAPHLQQLAQQDKNLVITQLDTSVPESIRDWAVGLKQHTHHIDDSVYMNPWCWPCPSDYQHLQQQQRCIALHFRCS
eukprot:GHUV01055955.1.p2 GENE.GHUV01055955.1~~GHUV01055955.1.p2  ORF type:complete len:116 (+),score=47.28 GHUV01055955.1:653-1000(+)